MSVGLRLKEVRKSAGLTIEQLSARTRIPASVIEDLERDNFSPGQSTEYMLMDSLWTRQKSLTPSLPDL